MSEERVIQLVALVIAELIVAAGWVAILVPSIWLINRRIARLAAPDSKMEPWGWLVGLASFCFWPLAIVLGILFLRDPKMMRVGRACAIAGLLNVTMAVVIAEVITAILYIRFPEYIPR